MKRRIITAIIISLIFVLTSCSQAREHKEEIPANQEVSSVTEISGVDSSIDEPEAQRSTPEQEADTEIETIPDEETANQTETEAEQMLKIEIGAQVLYAEFEANSSAEALKEKLTEEPLTLDMHDYGNFEKVSALPWSLPRNDTQITTKPGDVILYLGNELTIYYDTNSWNFTRVARIKDTDKETLKGILGEGNVTVTFSVE